MIVIIESGPDGPTVWLDSADQTEHRHGVVSPWTADEAAIVAGVLAAQTVVDDQNGWRETLAAGMAAFTAAKAAALGDVATAAAAKAAAEGLQSQAVAAETLDLTNPAVLQSVVAALVQFAAQVAAGLVDLETWRGNVDTNAAAVDDALIYLAQLAQTYKE